MLLSPLPYCEDPGVLARLVILRPLPFPPGDRLRLVMHRLLAEVMARQLDRSGAHTMDRVALGPVEPALTSEALLGGYGRAGMGRGVGAKGLRLMARIQSTALRRNPRGDFGMPDGKVTLRVTNRLDRPRNVVLEPWTGEYTLQPGSSFDIVAEGDLSRPLEVEVVDDRIVLYAFDSAGAMLRIFQDGSELLKSE